METLKFDPASGVALRAITRANFYEILALKVGADQTNFVAPNVKSLAEAWLEPSFEPFGVYHDDELVGYTMYGYEDPPGRWWVVRLMIDERFQHRGYGRAAMQLLIPLMIERHRMSRIVTSYAPGNDVAGGLYRSLGFQDTGQMEDGEHLVVLDVTTSQG